MRKSNDQKNIDPRVYYLYFEHRTVQNQTRNLSMSNIFERFNTLMSRKGWVLLAIIFFSSAILIVVNYYTIKTTTAVRAYVNGESLYSKGQKDATRHLILYITEEKETHYDLFKEHIRVPVGDRIAREELSAGGEEDVAYHGFIQGKNHPEDVNNLIWLFKHFKDVSFMRDAIEIWKDADQLIAKLVVLAGELHNQIDQSNLSSSEKSEYIARINVLTNDLTAKEQAFSGTLGVAARQIETLLFWINLFVITTIAASATILIASIIQDLEYSREELRKKNEGLIATNLKLDSFVYASSHDLKSPINNLEGLLHLLSRHNAKIGDEGNRDRVLIEKMQQSTDSLKNTIADIENLMKVERTAEDDVDDIDLQKLLTQILSENEMSFNLNNVLIDRQFEVREIRYSHMQLRSILYNLVSNAIKYASPNRKPHVTIRTFNKDGQTLLQVQDNGVGIDLDKYGDKLFQMFKRFHSDRPGSGLGLYAVKQIVEKNNGSVVVESTPDSGATFTIIL